MSIQLSLSYTCKAINFDNCQIFFFQKYFRCSISYAAARERNTKSVRKMDRRTDGWTDGQATKQTII